MNLLQSKIPPNSSVSSTSFWVFTHTLCSWIPAFGSKWFFFLKPGCKYAFKQRNAGEPSLQPHIIPDIVRKCQLKHELLQSQIWCKAVNKHSHTMIITLLALTFQSYPFVLFLIVLNNNSFPFTSFRVVNSNSKQTATALNYKEKRRVRWTGISALKTEYSIRYTVSSRGQRALYNKLYSEGLRFFPYFNNQHLRLLHWTHKSSLQISWAEDPLQSFWASALTSTDECRSISSQDAVKWLVCKWSSF